MIICNSIYVPQGQITGMTPKILTFDQENNVIERLSYQVGIDATGRYQFSILNESGDKQPIPLLAGVR